MALKIVCGILGAFILAARVKLIPRDTVTIELENLNIKINVDKIPDTSFITRLILKQRSIGANIFDENLTLFLNKYKDNN